MAGVSTDGRLATNTHVHIPPNFSAFSTVGAVVEAAVAENIRVLGVSNYYHFGVYEQFAELSGAAGVFPLFGLEIVCRLDELAAANTKINDPGNPGKMYLCGKGITRFAPMNSAATAMDTIRRIDSARLVVMIERLNRLFAAGGVPTAVSEESVRAAIVLRHGVPARTVYLQERHVAQAFQEELFARVDQSSRGAALRAICQAEPGPARDAVSVQNAIRTHLMKAGRPGYVAEESVDFEHAYQLILDLGGIPCYPVLADGATPMCPFENPIGELVRSLTERSVHCAELIPDRNSPEVLSAYARELHEAGLVVCAGTEHNTLEMRPMQAHCADGSAIPEPIQDIFWEGACVVAAHQHLTENGEAGYVDAAGRPNPAYPTAEARRGAFARIGAAVIDKRVRREPRAATYGGSGLMTSTASAASTEAAALATLVNLSHSYGSDPELVLAGGGNTSVKFDDHLLVKGSGTALATVGPDGFVDLDRPALQRLLDSELSSSRAEREAEFKRAVLAARREPDRGQRPSVEAVLHHLMPGRFVVHLHATLVNAFSCCTDGKKLIEERLGDDVLWLDLVDPGFLLAKALRDGLAAFELRTGRDCPHAVIMQNHGLVVSGDTAEEIDGHVDWLFAALREIQASVANGEAGAQAAITGVRARELVNVIGPALRALLGTDDALKIATFDDSEPVATLVASGAGGGIAMGGPLTPDQIVYCRSFPLWFETRTGEAEAELVGRLGAAVRDYLAAHRVAPKVVLVRGLGMFACGDTWSEANTTRLVYRDAIAVMAGARAMGGVRYLDDDFRTFIENWEVESYRRAVAAASAAAGRAAGRVALVTGAAQGFGLEIAQDLVGQGGHVALADVNLDGVQSAAGGLSASHGDGRAVGLAMNVADADSVARALHLVVREYGGLDLLVSNAGVLRADSVKTQSERDFDLSTAVNYKGYFLCVRSAAPILATQHAARPGYWSDIVQINSKSGLAGSNKNFAYAGSKFGGVGLTQSFALELVADGIKVNSVCPGNFFDGPLWSDPETGLFVQYLRTGKVPGATTIADVKRCYEAKVPMSRGCTTPDVLRAIYYLVEQRYETGQALPVTGGQVMLH
jgi:rhamnose utilization protein RhaD (predicted bifunctional aldolase and dehydrogenase)/NAD(P)-dependent dehydrogenase (short-subunit alcohol dehydrogenase family)